MLRVARATAPLALTLKDAKLCLMRCAVCLHTFLRLLLCSCEQDTKDRVDPDGTEYAVEHGGKGNFDGLKIVSAGAAKNWQMQQSWQK